MKINIPYLVTVAISVVLLFIGHKFAANEFFVFEDTSEVIVRAKVLEVIERIRLDEGSDDYAPMQSDMIIFEAKLTSGAQKGETIIAMQSISNLTRSSVKEAAKGDTVLLVNYNDNWFFNGYLRTNKLLGLGIVFTLCVLIFGGKKGFNTILSLGLTCAAVFAVFIPSLLSGKNIYMMALLVCVYTVTMTLTIVIGFNKKSLAAAAGCLSGVAVTGIITLVMDKLLLLTGIVDEHSRYLINLPLENPINLRAIIFAGIIIGAMGAVMDVAMSIASSLWEIKESAEKVSFKSLFRSGLTIGRDIMGSMANTLILAYIGSSLSIVLVMGIYSSSLLALFNTEMIAIEILQALAGSLGILFAMPLTALICSVVYLREKKVITQGTA